MTRRALVLALFLAAIVPPGMWLALRPDSAERRRRKLYRADEAIRSGRFEAARVLLLDLVSEDPGHVGVRARLLGCLLSLKRNGEAKAQAEELLGLDPEDAPAHTVLAVAAAARGDLRRAIREARAGTRGHRVPPDAHGRLASLLFRAGRDSEGIREVARAIALDAVDPRIPPSFAAALARAGSDDLSRIRARRFLARKFAGAREALDRDTANPDLVDRFARLALLAGRAGEAAARLAALRALREPTRTERILLARCLAEAGRRKQAREVLSALPRGDPSPDLARAWLATGEPARALAVIRGRRGRGPVSVPLLRLEITALLAWGGRGPAGDLGRALDRLLSLRPDDERGREIRSRIRLSRGDPEGALRDAVALRRLAPAAPVGKWLQGLALLSLGEARSAEVLLAAGRSAASKEEEAARWILRAALLAGDGERASSEAARLGASAGAALRSGTAALAGDLEAAERWATSDRFGEDPLEDRMRAAVLLARAGRPAVARSLVAEMTREGSGALPVALLEALGDGAGIRRAPGAKQRGDLRALLARARALLAEKPLPGKELEDLSLRLRSVPGGAPHAEIVSGYLALASGDADEASAAAVRALEILPESPAARRLALLALPEGEIRGPRGLDLAHRLLEVSPADPVGLRVKAEALYRKARESMAGGRYRDAVADLDGAISAASGSARLRLLRGLASSLTGDVETTLIDARDLSGAGHARAGTWLRGLALLAEERWEEAAGVFRDLAGTGSGSRAVLAPLALSLLAAGRAGEALPAARRYAALAPRDPRARLLLAQALLRTGDVEGALRTARADGVGEVARRELAGRILLAAGRADRAVAELEPLPSIAPAHESGYALLSAALLAEGRGEEARRLAATAGERVPGKEFGPLLRAVIDRRLGDREGEMANLRRAVEAAPGSARAHRLLGERLLRDGARTEARARFEKAAALDPEDSGSRLSLALLAEGDGKRREARALYEEVVRIDPGNATALNNLAMHLVSSPGGAERALRLARRAVVRSPGDGRMRDTLAAVLAANGRVPEAADEALCAMKLSRKDPAVALRAARLLVRAERSAEARAAAAEAVRRAREAGRDEEAREAAALLRSLGGR